MMVILCHPYRIWLVSVKESEKKNVASFMVLVCLFLIAEFSHKVFNVILVNFYTPALKIHESGICGHRVRPSVHWHYSNVTF